VDDEKIKLWDKFRFKWTELSEFLSYAAQRNLPLFLLPREEWINSETGRRLTGWCQISQDDAMLLSDREAINEIHFENSGRQYTCQGTFTTDNLWALKKDVEEWLQSNTQTIGKEADVVQNNTSSADRSSILKLALGMAIDKYRYIPQASRNDATGDNKNSIASALQHLGLSLDADTIRRILTEAVKVLDYKNVSESPKK